MESQHIRLNHQLFQRLPVAGRFRFRQRRIANRVLTPNAFSRRCKQPSTLPTQTMPTVLSARRNRRLSQPQQRGKDILHHRNRIAARGCGKTDFRLRQLILIRMISTGGGGTDERNQLQSNRVLSTWITERNINTLACASAGAGMALPANTCTSPKRPNSKYLGVGHILIHQDFHIKLRQYPAIKP